MRQPATMRAVDAAPPLPPPLRPYPELVVNVCPTGPILGRDLTPHVPLQPDEVVEDVCRCLDLGAAMVHLHARDREGRPTHRADVYERMILGIRAHAPDAVVGVSCIGNDVPDLERRAEVLELGGRARPDFASLATSTFDLPSGPNPNPPDVVVALAERMTARGIRPEVECFDVGMVNVAGALLRRGVLRPPLYVNLILGGRTTCPPTARHLAVMVEDLPPDAAWAAGGIGVAQLPMNAMALAMGGHVRVGLEDSRWADHGRTRLATNEGLVRRIVELAELFGRRPASRGSARRLLGLDALEPAAEGPRAGAPRAAWAGASGA